MGSAQVQGIPKGHSKKWQALCIVTHEQNFKNKQPSGDA